MDTELTEEKPTKIRDMFDKADIGGDAGKVKWDRPFHKVMDIIQHIFAVNLLSMGLLGSFLQSVFTSIPTSWTLHLLISGLAIVVITFIRKLVAVLGGKFNDPRENFNPNGDKSMVRIIVNARFDNSEFTQ